MSRFVKALLVVVFAAWTILGGATVATSATPSPSPSQEYGCLQDSDDYGPPGPCELQIQLLKPFCDNDVPKLSYAVKAIGSPNTTVTITWINPGGADFVQSDLPLTGTVLWPGAVVDDNGNAVDWPGWTLLPDGTWVEGDQWDWVRPDTQVKFEVNPEMTVDVTYPPSSPQCLTSPLNAAPPAPELSSTGSNTMPIVIAGAGLVAVGGLLMFLARRRHQAS